MGSNERAVVDLAELDQAQVATVGGKGAALAELSHLEGVAVPPGFCVTTSAFRRAIAQAPSIDDRLDRLSHLDAGDRDAIGDLSAEIRRTVEAIAIPGDVVAAIDGALRRAGEHAAYAVRSSATTEDSPTASYAGQHDSFLHISGLAAILRHIRRAWASLFTERAVTYRLRNGLDHRQVHMAVVVQEMVVAHASGILFTADPVTSNRKVACVEAVPGLGEDLVCGLVGADRYEVRDGQVVSRTIDPTRPGQPALADEQVVALTAAGRRIEARFGRPQDIEWCLAGDGLKIVQSRPITTLFPVPTADDDGRHVYVSVGHQQMMTDPMRPLGLSLWQLTAMPRMHEAAGRLFVDVIGALASPASRGAVLSALGKSDPLIGDALQTIVDRGDVIPPAPEAETGTVPPARAAPAPIDTDPAIVTGLIASSQASTAALQRAIGSQSGPALLEFIAADIQELKRILFDPRSGQVYMAAMAASEWLNEHLQEWLGDKNAADTLTLSVPDNVTSEMGLALLDVADAVRPHPEVVAFLHETEDDNFLDGLTGLAGGPQARDAIAAFLGRHGMRCVGEIDITRPRWSERPALLAPMILANVERFEPGESERRFAQGRTEALDKQRELLERLRALPGDGEQKAAETKRMIDRVRTFIGYREYPKYFIVGRYMVYKQALMREAERLVRAGTLREKDDIIFLTFAELHEATRTHAVDARLIARRKRAFDSHHALTPPRVITSEGEVFAGAYHRRDGAPAGALLGLPVSGGVVEGRARVVLDVAEARLEPGDILVTAFTDPSWSPLFVAATGLVTEVGGLMTHGAVVAREYGLPAVVGVEHATRLIEDGQRIRVNGTDGYVEILS
jgi:phosphoenolpyruvate synthase/pyruvate phosphate dikinase